jgi:hypothetical protein
MKITRNRVNRALSRCEAQRLRAIARGDHKAAQDWATQIFNIQYATRRRPI